MCNIDCFFFLVKNLGGVYACRVCVVSCTCKCCSGVWVRPVPKCKLWWGWSSGSPIPTSIHSSDFHPIQILLLLLHALRHIHYLHPFLALPLTPPPPTCSPLRGPPLNAAESKSLPPMYASLNLYHFSIHIDFYR